MIRVFVAVALSALLLPGCRPDGPTQSQNVTVVVPLAGPTVPEPTASPTPPGQTVVAAVLVSAFGSERGPAPPSTGGSAITVGNSQPVTCTPKATDGTDVPPESHGPAPDFFGMVAGADNIRADQTSNPFNLDLVAIGAGGATLRCVVHGVSGELALTAIAAP